MPFFRLLPVLLLASLVAGLASAPTHAAAPKRYSVSVKATHKVGWSWRDEADGQDCRAWLRGDGDEDTQITTKRAGVMEILGGGRTPASVFLVRTPQAEASFSRDRKVVDHPIPNRCTPCGPNSEYGPCGPDAHEDTLVAACGPIETKGMASITIIDGRITAYLGVAYERDERCPKPLEVPSNVTVNREPPAKVRFSGGFSRILDLRRGRSVTIHAEASLDERGKDECNELAVFGYDECSLTKVSVKVRRLR